MNTYAALSPYLIPASMSGKRVNIGDGFILRAIERQIGAFAPENVFSSREAPGPAEYTRLTRAKTAILAGANQLDDNFSVWPGLSATDLANMPIRFVPFGIGFNGVADRNKAFSPNALASLVAIHEKLEFSSWRCPITVRMIEAALPQLKGRALMTGCPVVYDKPLLEGNAFHALTNTVAVTVTERDNFWEREAATLRYAAAKFRHSRRLLILHQVFDEPTSFELRYGTIPGVSLFLKRRAKLRVLARRLGFEIVSPKSADEALQIYKTVDFHLGSRLHAHLHLLSQNRRSLLTYVDDRMKGFAEFLKFPLSTPDTFDRDMEFDFEIVRAAARASYKNMEKFTSELDAVG
jgi:hypothetical protein